MKFDGVDMTGWCLAAHRWCSSDKRQPHTTYACVSADVPPLDEATAWRLEPVSGRSGWFYIRVAEEKMKFDVDMTGWCCRTPVVFF